MKGYHYSPDDIITLCIEGEMPVFARIVEVYLYEANKVLFLVDELTTILFDHHYHAFQIGELEDKVRRFVASTDLHDPVPPNTLQCCKPELRSTYFVVTQYKIV